MGFARNRTSSMFSQRHYEAIAKRLNNVYMMYHSIGMDWALEPLDNVTNQLSSMFGTDNPNFKLGKFREAVRGDIDET